MTVTDEMLREIERALSLEWLAPNPSRWLRALLDERQDLEGRMVKAMENSLSRQEAKAQARREGWDAAIEAAVNRLPTRETEIRELRPPWEATK